MASPAAFTEIPAATGTRARRSWAPGARGGPPILFPYNSEPVNFENNLVFGKALVIARPLEDRADTESQVSWRYADFFHGTPKRLEVEVQIRFKRPFDTIPYLRISPQQEEELPMPMFARSLCRVILAAITRVSGGGFTHCLGGVGEGLPHLTFPLSQLCSIIATSPGCSPPALGSQAMRAARTAVGYGSTAWKQCLPFDTQHTYTIGFYTRYFDLTSWELCNIPGLGALPLEYFFRTARSIQLCALSTLSGGEVYFDLRLHKGAAGNNLYPFGVDAVPLDDEGDEVDEEAGYESDSSFYSARSYAPSEESVEDFVSSDGAVEANTGHADCISDREQVRAAAHFDDPPPPPADAATAAPAPFDPAPLSAVSRHLGARQASAAVKCPSSSAPRARGCWTCCSGGPRALLTRPRPDCDQPITVLLWRALVAWFTPWRWRSQALAPTKAASPPVTRETPTRVSIIARVPERRKVALGAQETRHVRFGSVDTIEA